jgi:upstream activation factor subunit UAF30
MSEAVGIVREEHRTSGGGLRRCASLARVLLTPPIAMPIQGKKESKQRAIKSPQTSGRTTRGALAALVTPTPELAHIVGAQPLSRGEAVKRVWDYIKKHDLQDPANKRMIRADVLLRPVFDGHDQLSMFEMTAYISRHLVKQG